MYNLNKVNQLQYFFECIPINKINMKTFLVPSLMTVLLRSDNTAYNKTVMHFHNTVDGLRF